MVGQGRRVTGWHLTSGRGPWHSTLAAPRWRPGWSGRTARSSDRTAYSRTASGSADDLLRSGCAVRSRAGGRRRRPTDLVGIGVGCGGPMTLPGGRGRAAQHPGLAPDSRYGPRSKNGTVAPSLVDNDAKALALGEYTDRGRARGALPAGDGRLDRRRRRHRGGRAADPRCARQRRPHRSRHRLPRRAARAAAAPAAAWKASPPGLVWRDGPVRRRRRACCRTCQIAPTGEDIVNAAWPAMQRPLRVRRRGRHRGRAGHRGAAALLDLDRVVIGGSIALGTPRALFFEPLLQTLRAEAQPRLHARHRGVRDAV